MKSVSFYFQFSGLTSMSDSNAYNAYTLRLETDCWLVLRPGIHWVKEEMYHCCYLDTLGILILFETYLFFHSLV